MAPRTTLYHFEVALSDVDRGVYEAIDLRVAQHPSETIARVLLRTLAYCLAYEEGIAFSSEGLASPDEPPLSVRDATGRLVRWIEIGGALGGAVAQGVEGRAGRGVHRRARALRRQAEGKTIHGAASLEVWAVDPALLDAIADWIGRRTKLELTRTDGELYVTVDGGPALQAALRRVSLADAG